MKPVAEMSCGELAAWVATHLRTQGVELVLSGGSCVTIYSENLYVSGDLDFIETGLAKRGVIARCLKELGFEQINKFFKHPQSQFLVEFPAGPLSVGDEPVKVIEELRFDTGLLKLLSPTDCVKDRLAAFYHWKDAQSLDQALLVARHQRVDIGEIRRWSRAEGMSGAFEEICARFEG